MESTQHSLSQTSFWSSGSSLSLKKPEDALANPDGTEKPVEIPQCVFDALGERGFDVNEHGVVSFAPGSRSHPRSWPLYRKVFDSALICFLEFFMTALSNTGTTVAEHAHNSFGVTRVQALVCFTTVYLIGQAFGGLIFPPIAESFGHRTIYVTTTFAFAVGCLVTAAGHHSLAAVLIGRGVSGLVSAIPATVAAGSLENMWDEKARITLIHTWISSAVLGLACGPPLATYLSTSTLGWPWIYYLAAIVALVCTIMCLGMHESRPSQVLRENVKTVARKTSFEGLSVDDGLSLPSLSDFVQTTLTQPVRLFCTEPVVTVVSIMGAIVYGNLYMFTDALSVVYVGGFGLSERPASLIFLVFGVGIIPTFLPRIYDYRLSNRRKKQNIPSEPEDKLFGFYVAAPVLAVGLWWFATTVPPLITGISPWASIVSLLLVGYGTVEFDNVLSGYLTDCYCSYAASANAPMSFLRAILSGTFPLFGQQMFQGMGSNNALFILAGLAMVFCGAAVWLKQKAKQLRLGSPFAEKSALSARSSDQSLSAKEAISQA